ncbi:MAG TPA: 30S ribosomal protein S8 [Actinomycetota bacterium]|jgi:small subunit ribosomal protein S8|nr:30S ribosomal protein S8 [Actinomycetota bacterium]
MMTDPVADMLARIRNAGTAHKDQVEIPASKLKEGIARVLADEGFVAGYRVEGDPPKRRIVIDMKYGPDRERVISGLRRVSRPGRRVYADRAHLPRVQGGLGVAILSTSHGLLTDRQAARRRVGGEVLCYVW